MDSSNFIPMNGNTATPLLLGEIKQEHTTSYTKWLVIGLIFVLIGFVIYMIMKKFGYQNKEQHKKKKRKHRHESGLVVTNDPVVSKSPINSLSKLETLARHKAIVSDQEEKTTMIDDGVNDGGIRPKKSKRVSWSSGGGSEPTAMNNDLWQIHDYKEDTKGWGAGLPESFHTGESCSSQKFEDNRDGLVAPTLMTKERYLKTLSTASSRRPRYDGFGGHSRTAGVSTNLMDQLVPKPERKTSGTKQLPATSAVDSLFDDDYEQDGKTTSPVIPSQGQVATKLGDAWY